MRQVALNYQDNLLRVTYACVGTALIFSIWVRPAVMALWAGAGIGLTIIGDRSIRRLLQTPLDEPPNLRSWQFDLLVPRALFLVNWTALLFIGWDRGRPATYIFAFLFVMATLAQNTATSSVYAPMLAIEIAPKVVGALLFSGYWWLVWDESTDVIFGSAVPITLFYLVFVVRMAKDLRKAAHDHLETSSRLLEANERANLVVRDRDASESRTCSPQVRTAWAWR